MSKESAIAAFNQAAPSNSPDIASKAPSSPVEPSVAPILPESTDKARLDHLERREKAIRTESKRLQALKAELETAKAPKPRTEAEIREELKAQFLKDPTSFGLSYEDIGQKYLNQPSPEEQRMAQMQAQLETEKVERERLAQKFEETQTQAYKSAIKQISSQVAQLVANNDAFEAIQADGAQDAVVQLIEDVYKDEGIILDVEEAAAQIEEAILEKARSYSKLKKLQAAAETASPSTPAPVQKHTTPTLTHAMVQASKPTSSKDRRERAIAAYLGKLN